MRVLVSKRLEVWTREIYENVQVWDTKKSNHKKIEREKRLATKNYNPYQKRNSRHPGRFIIVAGMLVLAMQATESNSRNNTNFAPAYRTPIGLDNRCLGCNSNIMNNFIGSLVE